MRNLTSIREEENQSMDLAFRRMTDAILTNHQSVVTGCSYPTVPVNLTKSVLALAIGAANTILFYQVSGAFAKDYLGLEAAGQGLFSFSNGYANFFLSVYTSLILFDLVAGDHFARKLMQTIPSIPYTERRRQRLLFVSITGASLISAIPTMAPLSDLTEQGLSFFSNTIMYMYALYAMYHIMTTSRELKTFFDDMRAGVLQSTSPRTLQDLKEGAELFDCLKSYRMPTPPAPISKTLTRVALAYTIYATFSVVTPYILVMIDSLNNPNADNGFLHYIVSRNHNTRLFIALSFSLVTNAIFAVLSAYFGYQTVFDFHDMLFNTSRISKKEYFKTWCALKTMQAIFISLSWSTGVKLFLDFCGGPTFENRTGAEVAVIHFSSAFIALGIYSFNLYSNLQLVDIGMAQLIKIGGNVIARQKLQILEVIDEIEFNIHFLRRYNESGYKQMTASLLENSIWQPAAPSLPSRDRQEAEKLASIHWTN